MHQTTQVSDVESNKELVHRLTINGFNYGDIEGVEQDFHDDYEVHAPGIPPLPKGPEAFRRAVNMWRSIFPDIEVVIDDLVGEGDKVFYRRTTRGTHRGPLLGFEPTGKAVTVYGMECHRVVDGKVAESWIGDDVPAILFQIGAVHMNETVNPSSSTR